MFARFLINGEIEVDSIKVKDLMVPLAEYATVSEDATLYEAIMALEEAQRRCEEQRFHYTHRAILVVDREQQVIGKLSQLAVLRGMEPRYENVGDLGQLSRFGWNPDFVRSIPQRFGLWEKPMDDLCRKAAKAKVATIMDQVSPEEFIDTEDSLDRAIHLLLMGQFQSLVVKQGEQTVGILRLSDVFKKICDAIKQCEYK